MAAAIDPILIFMNQDTLTILSLVKPFERESESRSLTQFPFLLRSTTQHTFRNFSGGGDSQLSMEGTFLEMNFLYKFANHSKNIYIKSLPAFKMDLATLLRLQDTLRMNDQVKTESREKEKSQENPRRSVLATKEGGRRVKIAKKILSDLKNPQGCKCGDGCRYRPLSGLYECDTTERDWFYLFGHDSQ